MRIAIAQLTASTDPVTNLALIEAYARRAATRGASLVVFPEAMMCSFARPSSEVSEPFDGPWARSVRDMASDLGITIIVGMFTDADDDRVYNTLLVTGADEARYDKIHLFDALGFHESKHIAPGRSLELVDLEGTLVGLATCYDIRFPNQFTRLATTGAKVIVVCASWAPGPFKTHQWRTLATARAMDSTAFVVAVDQAAAGDPERRALPTGVGHSIVVDPTGRVLLELGTAPELAFVDIDPAEADTARGALPLLSS